MYISNKVTKEQLHKKIQKTLYQHCEIKVQLNPYTSIWETGVKKTVYRMILGGLDEQVVMTSLLKGLF